MLQLEVENVILFKYSGVQWVVVMGDLILRSFNRNIFA